MNKQGPNGIPYCDYTWNPATGCLHGCTYCFAERIAKRFTGSKAFPDGFKPKFHPERLGEPLKIKKPSVIFVSDMGDLFGDWVPERCITEVLGVVDECPQHMFLFLTKNPKRYKRFNFPNNAWIGTSVENQKAADERIPVLLQALAKVKFISSEPFLGPLDIAKYIGYETHQCKCGWHDTQMDIYPHGRDWYCPECRSKCITQPGVSWVIAGGESGPGARPMHPDWVRGLKDQCQAAGTKFFFKQWGNWAEVEPPIKSKQHPNHKGLWKYQNGDFCRLFGKPCDTAVWMEPIGKKLAGRDLDGRTFDEFPGVKSLRLNKRQLIYPRKK